MELVERYVYAVGRHLPRKMRADVEPELHSLLLDSVESRSEESGQPATDELIAEVLKEFGPPRKMATSYMPQPQYVVGPQLFPVYLLVLTIVACVLAAMQAFGFMVAVAGVPLFSAEAGRLFGSGLLNLGASLLSAIGSITLTFYILERVIPHASLEEDVEWDPTKLPASVRVNDRISVPGQVVTICIMLGLLILFNFFPQVIGVYNYSNGEWTFSPMLAPTFRHFMPWFNVAWLGTLAMSVWLLVRGRWEPAMRWADLAREIFSAIVLLMVATGPSLVGAGAGISANDLIQALGNAAEAVATGVDMSIRTACGIAFVVVCVGALAKLLQLVRAPGKPLVEFKRQ